MRSDEPIAQSEQDALDRGKLAESIASKILSRNTESCMVIGISGPWGSGKSSLLNLIEERVRGTKAKRPSSLVLRFNPWRYSRIEELVAAFFGEVRQVVGLVDKKELASDISKTLDRMAIALLALSAVPALQPAAVLAAGAKSGAKVIKSLIRTDSLEKIKSDLNGYLQEAGVHLVVLIDDLDRAEPQCVRLMLQLIRLNADFSGTTYILAFDRERTARALSTSLGGNDEDGRDYLGKLIQVPFDLPIIESLRLKVEVADAANPLYQAIFDDPELAGHHHEVTNAGFYELFESIRDAKRLANALAVTLPLVWCEVNAVDFVVLEALRLRHPQLHSKLHAYRWLLLNEPRGLEEAVDDYLNRGGKPDREGHQRALKDLLRPVEGVEGRVRSILEALFPRLSRLSYDHSTWRLPDNAEWSRQRLVCSTDHFDNYFLLAPGLGAVSETELDQALSLADHKDSEALAKTLLELDEQGKGTELMRRISMRAPDLTSGQIETAIMAFLDASSDAQRWGHPDQNPQPLALSAIYMATLASAIDDDGARVALIGRCIESGKGLCGATRFTSAVLDMEFGARPVVRAEKKPDVSAAACARIQASGASGDLLHSPCAASLLYRWLEWDAEQTKEYVESLVQDGETLVLLLDSLRRTAGRYSDTSGYEEPSPQVLPRILNFIVDMEVVEHAAETAKQVLKEPGDAQAVQMLQGFVEGVSALAEDAADEEEQIDV